MDQGVCLGRSMPFDKILGNCALTGMRNSLHVKSADIYIDLEHYLSKNFEIANRVKMARLIRAQH